MSPSGSRRGKRRDPSIARCQGTEYRLGLLRPSRPARDGKGHTGRWHSRGQFGLKDFSQGVDTLSRRMLGHGLGRRIIRLVRNSVHENLKLQGPVQIAGKV